MPTDIEFIPLTKWGVEVHSKLRQMKREGIAESNREGFICLANRMAKEVFGVEANVQ